MLLRITIRNVIMLLRITIKRGNLLMRITFDWRRWRPLVSRYARPLLCSAQKCGALDLSGALMGLAWPSVGFRCLRMWLAVLLKQWLPLCWYTFLVNPWASWSDPRSLSDQPGHHLCVLSHLLQWFQSIYRLKMTCSPKFHQQFNKLWPLILIVFTTGAFIVRGFVSRDIPHVTRTTSGFPVKSQKRFPAPGDACGGANPSDVGGIA